MRSPLEPQENTLSSSALFSSNLAPHHFIAPHMCVCVLAFECEFAGCIYIYVYGCIRKSITHAVHHVCECVCVRMYMCDVCA